VPRRPVIVETVALPLTGKLQKNRLHTLLTAG
jgi:hypothetical protein